MENDELRSAFAKRAKISFSLAKGPDGFGVVFGGAQTLAESRAVAPGILVKGIEVRSFCIVNWFVISVLCFCFRSNHSPC